MRERALKNLIEDMERWPFNYVEREIVYND
jgi:hypothetical protein